MNGQKWAPDALREFMELKARVDVLTQRMDSGDMELAKQAERYDEHLEKLNGEQARLGSDRDRYLQKEVHEPWKQGVDQWRDTINRQLATSGGRTSALVSGAALLGAVVAALITAFFKG